MDILSECFLVCTEFLKNTSLTFSGHTFTPWQIIVFLFCFGIIIFTINVLIRITEY